MTVNEYKQLSMEKKRKTRHDWKWLDMTGNVLNGRKWLNMARNGLNCLDMAENGRKWMGMAGNGWNL